MIVLLIGLLLLQCSLVESIPRVNVISVETIEACNHEVSVMSLFCFSLSLLSDLHLATVFELWLLKFETCKI